MARLVLQHILILAAQLPEPPEKCENTTVVRRSTDYSCVLGYFAEQVVAAF